MGKINPLYIATATAVGGRNGNAETDDDMLGGNVQAVFEVIGSK